MRNQQQQVLYIRGAEGTALGALGGPRKVAGPQELPIFPNPGVAVIRSDLLRVAPGVNGNESVGNGRGDVRRPAIDTDRETRPTNEPDQLQNPRVIEQVDAIVGHGDFAFGSTDEHDAGRRERVAKFFDGQIAERFAPTAREGMEQDKRLVFVETLDRDLRSEAENEVGAESARRNFR